VQNYLSIVAATCVFLTSLANLHHADYYLYPKTHFAPIFTELHVLDNYLYRTTAGPIVIFLFLLKKLKQASMNFDEVTFSCRLLG
jgi:hypothetical protein